MIRAMHDRHKLSKAMTKFREGLAEMSAVDPDNPENPSVINAVSTLEEKVDYWLEEVDKVPEVGFDPAPWKAREGGSVTGPDGVTIADLIDSGANRKLIAAAPILAYAAFDMVRAISNSNTHLTEAELQAYYKLKTALQEGGIDVSF